MVVVSISVDFRSKQNLIPLTKKATRNPICKTFVDPSKLRDAGRDQVYLQLAIAVQLLGGYVL
jgi:hypothetical protein